MVLGWLRRRGHKIYPRCAIPRGGKCGRRGVLADALSWLQLLDLYSRRSNRRLPTQQQQLDATKNASSALRVARAWSPRVLLADALAGYSFSTSTHGDRTGAFQHNDATEPGDNDSDGLSLLLIRGQARNSRKLRSLKCPISGSATRQKHANHKHDITPCDVASGDSRAVFHRSRLLLSPTLYDPLRSSVSGSGFRGVLSEPAPMQVLQRRGDEPADRLAEIGEILALGLVRLRARQSSQTEARTGESSLDCVAHQSGDANPEKPENRR